MIMLGTSLKMFLLIIVINQVIVHVFLTVDEPVNFIVRRQKRTESKKEDSSFSVVVQVQASG